jgi:hypothetical protein
MFSSISNSYFWKKNVLKLFYWIILKIIEIKILSIDDSYDEKRATLDLKKIKFFIN